MNWTEQQYADHFKRTGVPAPESRVDVSAQPFSPPAVAGRYALGRLPKGTMNKTEAAYAEHLEMLKRAGEVQWFKFEPFKLRLADATFYTPDFTVLLSNGLLEMHEVKGFWEEDARVKIKVAAELYPFRFIAVTAKPKKDGGGWRVEDFSR